MGKKTRFETPIPPDVLHTYGPSNRVTPLPPNALGFKVKEPIARTKKVNDASGLVEKFDNPVKTGMAWTIKDLDTEFEKRKRIKKAW